MAVPRILFTRARQANCLTQDQTMAMLAVQNRGGLPIGKERHMESQACETTDSLSMACRLRCAQFTSGGGRGLLEKVPARDRGSAVNSGWCIQFSRDLQIALHGSHFFTANKACKGFGTALDAASHQTSVAVRVLAG